MKIGICLLTNEPDYLEEWIDHHKKYGFDKFFIYFDDNIPENVVLQDNVIYNLWDCKNSPQGQMRVYEYCCKNNTDLDYILCIDSDEFYESKTGNVKQDVSNLIDSYGRFDGLGIYWRMYGSNPFFETREPVKKYTQWHPNDHIKSLINPKVVLKFYDPHKVFIDPNKKYIDELGRKVLGPIGNHTSETIWIKHTWTRSKSEWEAKVNRKGWYEFYDRKIDEFDNYNKSCINND